MRPSAATSAAATVANGASSASTSIWRSRAPSATRRSNLGSLGSMPSEKYEYGVDFDRIEAVDIHTHVEVDGHGRKAYDDELVEAVGQYFKMVPGALSSVDALADEYRRHNTAAVV